MKRQFLHFFILLIFNLSFSQILSAQQIPEKLTGNWINEKTNEWTLGLFEKFAIYQNDFWQYDTAVQKKENYRITIEKNGKKVVLNIKPQKDSTLYITVGKNKKQLFSRYTKGYRFYTVPDTVSFKQPTFSADTATIIGYYHNMDNLQGPAKEHFISRVFKVTIPDIILGKQIDYFTEIDSLGRFKIKIPVLGPQAVFIDWGRITKNTVLEPGEQMFFYANLADIEPHHNDHSYEAWEKRPKEMIVMGKNARLHNELFHTPNFVTAEVRNGRNGVSEKCANDMEYLHYFEKIYQTRMNMFQEFLNTTTLSDRAIYFRQQDFLYNFAFYLMQHTFDLRNSNTFDSPEYMKYVKNTFTTDNNINIFISTEFGSFIRDYSGYFERQGSVFLPNGGRYHRQPIALLWEKLVQEGKIPADSAFVGKRLDDCEPQMIQAQVERDTATLNKIMFEMKDIMNTYNHYRLDKDLGHRFIQYIHQQTFSSIDSVTHSRELKDILFAQYYCRLMEGMQMPLDKFQLQILNDQVTTPAIKNIVMSRHNELEAIEQEKFIPLESLQSSEKLMEFRDAKKLLEEILKPYKGKIVYLDIWGVWCSPCREEMSHAPAVIEHFKDKDVIFLYLANRSPQEGWKNMIKKIGLTGPNIVHYNLFDKQQAMLEYMLNVNSYPSYLVFDKEGNLINNKPPKPSQKEDLINYINSLLK